MKRNYLIKLLLHELEKSRLAFNSYAINEDDIFDTLNGEDYKFLVELYEIKFGEDYESTFIKLSN